MDITERREMEQALRPQEEFQRYLLESFPDLILVIDLNERYSFVSARIRDLLGYKPEDMVGKKIEEEQDLRRNFCPVPRRERRDGKCSDSANTGRVIAMEAGEPCGLRPVRCSMRRR